MNFMRFFDVKRLAVLAVCIVALGCTKKSDSVNQQGVKPGEVKVKGNEIAVIHVECKGEDWGKIRIQFYPDKAPGHVENFLTLAKKGFYNGTTFHRVIPGFMIQGGDPNSKDDDRSNDGLGGPGYTIPAEFNDIPHTRGIVSMARAQDPDSAGSQFFICVKDCPFLDGQYTVFGKVIAGMDVVDRIVNVPRDKRDNPIDKVVMKKIEVLTTD